MKIKKSFGLLAIIISSVFFLTGMGQIPTAEKNKCDICGREVHGDMVSDLKYNNKGIEIKACCPECALHYEEQSKSRADSFTVTDYISGKKIEFNESFLVQGSDLSPCCKKEVIHAPEGQTFSLKYDRCLPSTIAFEKKDDALKYIANHGGTLKIPQGIRPAFSK